MSERRIRGIVQPGKGGARCEDGTWNFGFTLEAWREVGGPIVRTPLYLTYNRPDQSALAELWPLVPDYGVVTVRYEEPRSVLAIEPREADAELEALATELSRPLVHTHPYFGELTYNPALQWFEANLEGLSVSIHAEPNADLTKAEHATRHAKASLTRLVAQVAAQMISLYNDTWREEDAPVESEASFAKRLRVDSVVVDSVSGRTRLYLDDDDLFAGHTIEVFLDDAGELSSATLAG